MKQSKNDCFTKEKVFIFGAFGYPLLKIVSPKKKVTAEHKIMRKL